MNVNLTVDEAQALLDGINVVIQELAKDVTWFSDLFPEPEHIPDRDRVLADLHRDLTAAKSARSKIQKVA